MCRCVLYDIAISMILPNEPLRADIFISCLKFDFLLVFDVFLPYLLRIPMLLLYEMSIVIKPFVFVIG